MVDTEGKVKVGDFGISKVANKFEETFRVSTRINDIGTWPYMGPELFLKPPVITRASDVYAWAIIFIEMLNQENPWKEVEIWELINLHKQ